MMNKKNNEYKNPVLDWFNDPESIYGYVTLSQLLECHKNHTEGLVDYNRIYGQHDFNSWRTIELIIKEDKSLLKNRDIQYIMLILSRNLVTIFDELPEIGETINFLEKKKHKKSISDLFIFTQPGRHSNQMVNIVLSSILEK